MKRVLHQVRTAVVTQADIAMPKNQDYHAAYMALRVEQDEKVLFFTWEGGLFQRPLQHPLLSAIQLQLDFDEANEALVP
jgi:hypothetical protein